VGEIVRVVVLNGPSSVGKSSTARAIQAIAARPFLHLSMDAFLEMMPAKTLGHPDGLVFTPGVEDGMPSTAVASGPVLERALSGMRHAVAAMAARGNDLIVDDVMMSQGEEREYRALLGAYGVRIVGLFAPVAMLEDRERRRGDRDLGLARWQVERVHQGRSYDLEIDTSATTPARNAELICEAFGL